MSHFKVVLCSKYENVLHLMFVCIHTVSNTVYAEVTGRDRIPFKPKKVKLFFFMRLCVAVAEIGDNFRTGVYLFMHAVSSCILL